MVYESDFYTTRRPYRATPSLSTYTITSEPSRQVRILPGLGKVHVVHTYDRIVPYVGHKRLNVVTSSPIVVRVRPSTLYREYDRIENKYRPFSYNSYTNDYLNSDSHVRIVYLRNPISSSYPVYKSSTLYTTRYYPTFGSYLYYPTYLNSYYYSYPTYLNSYNYSYYPLTRRYHTYNFYPSLRWYDLAMFPSWRYNHYARMFDDETRSIRAQTASILQRIHDPVPRKIRSFPLPYVSRFDNYDDSYSGSLCKYQEMPARLSNDHYINRMLLSSPSSKSQYTVYSTDPVRKYFGQGHLACVTMVGEKSHPRRRNVYAYQDPVRNDIQLLSYYINKFRDEKALAKPIKVILSCSRPSRIFSVPRPLEGVNGPEESEELQKLKQERNSRLAKIMVIDEEVVKAEASVKVAEERARAAQKKEEEMKKLAERAAKKEESRNKKSILAQIQSELDGNDPKAEATAAEAAKKAAEEVAARKAAEEAAAKKAAEEEAAAQKAAEEEAAKKAEADAKAKKAAEDAKKKAEEDAAAARKKAEEEAAKKEKEAKEAAEKAAELERLAEQARQEELAKQAEIEQAKKEEEERARLEEEKRLAEAAKAEEERQQLLRLEEIARQAEEEKEAELARQAEELAELARQEAEIAEQTKHEEEAAEEQRKEADHAEIEKKEIELAELEQKEKELSELAEQARIEAEQAQIEVEQAEPAKIEDVNIEVVEETAPIVEEPETPEESASEPLQEPAEEVQE